MDLMKVILALMASVHVSECAAERRALLELNVNHVVKPEIRPGDQIQYKCSIQQIDTSAYEAVDIVVKIMLPQTLHFIESTVVDTGEYRGVFNNKNNVDYFVPSLPLHSKVDFNFIAVINDDHMSSGLHYASTPIKLRYRSKISANQITPFHDISMVAQVPYFIAGCSGPLGVTDGSIKFYQFSASSTQVDLKPHKVRMNGADDAWCADVRDTQPYIQVILTRKAKVTGLATWGRKGKTIWVRKYSLEFSIDGSMWYAYTDTGLTKQFRANDDQHTKVMHWLSEPFEANYVRLYPIQWSVGVCMRLELYGCDLLTKGNCIRPIGMENGQIPLASITEKIPPYAGFSDSRNWSRLNSVNPQFPYGWMADISQPDYLQIDLGSTFQITAIAVQAGYGSKAYVTKLGVSYSMDSSTWTEKENEEDKDKEFPGSVGGLLPDMVHFTPPFKARYIRIAPTDGNMVKSMRMELYGCLADDHADRKNAREIQLSRRSVLIDEVTGYIYVCIYTHDQSKSICKQSNDGRHWISLGKMVMGVIYQARVSRRLYAVDRQFHKIFSDNNGNTWFTIADQEWKRQLSDLDVNLVTNIEDILPTKMPDHRFTWTTQQGNKWGVSGTGVYMMGARSVEWTLCAVWKCCGL